MSDVPAITEVSGGVGGLEAQYAALLLLADHYDEAGDRARRWAARGACTVADGDLVASAVLSPGTFAAAEVAVLRATAGPDGALGRSVAWEIEGAAVREAVRRIIEADALVHDAVEVRDYALGRVVGSVAIAGLLATPPPMWPVLAVAARLGALQPLSAVAQAEGQRPSRPRRGALQRRWRHRRQPRSARPGPPRHRLRRCSRCRPLRRRRAGGHTAGPSDAA